MTNGISRQQLEFQELINHHLTYSIMVGMPFEGYKKLVLKIFNNLSALRNQGLMWRDVNKLVKAHYSLHIDDTDILFERRFSGITEEVTGFCSDPQFWTTDFESYMLKWERMFATGWYEKV